MASNRKTVTRVVLRPKGVGKASVAAIRRAVRKVIAGETERGTQSKSKAAKPSKRSV